MAASTALNEPSLMLVAMPKQGAPEASCKFKNSQPIGPSMKYFRHRNQKRLNCFTSQAAPFKNHSLPSENGPDKPCSLHPPPGTTASTTEPDCTVGVPNSGGNRDSIHIPVEHGEKTYQLAKYPPFLLISVFALP